MEKLKSKLMSTLGVFGYVLYLIFCVIVCGAPLLVLPIPWFIATVLFVLMMWFPIACSVLDLILWPAGLVYLISGPQDVISVIYYVLFAVNVVRLILAVVSALASRRSS